jgi:hypothetical protein
MSRRVVVPALVVAAVGVMFTLIAWAIILAAQAYSQAHAEPLPPGVQLHPPTTACAPTETPVDWYGRTACMTPNGMRYAP